MVNANLSAQLIERVSPLAHQQTPLGLESASVALSVRHRLAMVQVFAKKGNVGAIESALGIGSKPGEASSTENYTAFPLSPGQWMVSADDGSEGELCEQISAKIGDYGYVSEQSHGRVAFRVSGVKARSILQKGCRLDLHPSVAHEGFCAQTPMAQVGVLLHQVDNAPTYDLYVYSGFADSFWHWLSHSAAEFL